MAKAKHGTRRKALMLLCALVFIICLCMLISQLMMKLQGDRAESDMKDLYYGSVGFGAVACAEELPTVADEYLPAPVPNETFARLLEANPDTVGWLKVGEIIDTAVVKRDNEYYLTHNFFGEQTAEGTAFMDEGCEIWPADQHLIIHGHNMSNGNVFGRLKQYRDLEFLQENCVITFNTIYRDVQYVPFAVFDISAEPGYERYMDLQQFDYQASSFFDEFVEDALQRSYYNIPIDVEYYDQLLSLVTCSYFDVNGRLVVMFRAVRADEDPEALRAIYENVTLK